MIYFIQRGEDGPVKIGTSVDPDTRLRTLQTAVPEPLKLLDVIPGDRKREVEIQRDLAPFRINREWFEPAAELLTYIRSLRAVEFVVEDGRPYAVLVRNAVESPTSPCPFCGKRHIHGVGDGHRIAHCTKVVRPEIRTSDGTTLRQSHGYIIVTRAP